MSRVIAHIDLNAFFATAEELRHPEYVGKPLGIGGAGRAGIISTCNYAARKYGVHSGMPTFQAQKACPSLILLPGDYEYYQVMSNSFFAYIKRFSSTVEAASIDECYVDLTEAIRGKDAIALLHEIQDGVYQELGLSCSIGVATTKWLAKMSSDLKKPMGLVIMHKSDVESKLYPLPIDAFWGIGKKTTPLLRSLGILTIGDLAKKLKEKDEDTYRILGKMADQALLYLEGKSDDVVSTIIPDPKSIGHSHTLIRDIQSFDEAELPLRELCRAVSERAIRAGKVGFTVSLSVKDNKFRVHQKSVTLEEGINQEIPIFRIVARLFQDNYANKEGLYIRLLGVTLGRLEDKAKQTVQMTLWNYEEYENADRTKLLIEELNRQMDADLFTRASKLKKEE